MSDNVNSIQFNPDVKKSNKISALFIIKILVFFGVMIAFYFGVQKISGYFVTSCSQGYKYDEVQKRCTIVCDASQFRDPDNPDGCMPCPTKGQVLRANGMCGINCTGDQTECGVGCIGPESECINGSPCKKTKIIYPSYTGSGPLGNPQCCPPGNWANANKTACINTCPTGSTGCGESCCPNGQTCCNGVCCGAGSKCVGDANTKVCCPAEQSRENDTICCKNWDSVNKVCCPSDSNIETVTNSNGQTECMQTCTDGTTKCKWKKDAGQICVNKTLYNLDGTINNTTSGCRDSAQCGIQNTDYFPAALRKDSVNPPEGQSDYIRVCSHKDSNLDPTYPKATCRRSDIQDYRKYALAGKSGELSRSCDTKDCINRFESEIGLLNINTESLTGTGFNRCKANFACAAADGTKETCGTICPLTVRGLPDGSNPQCCFNTNGTYNGLLCEQGYICYKDKNDGKDKCAKSAWAGPDTSYECVPGPTGYYDSPKNKYFDTMEACKAYSGYYRCNKLPWVKKDGSCYYYNPPIKNGFSCGQDEGVGAYTWVREIDNNTTTSFQGCCEHSGSDWSAPFGIETGNVHTAVKETTNNIPFGVYYCQGLNEIDGYCNMGPGKGRMNQSQYTRCNQQNGCSDIRQVWYTDSDDSGRNVQDTAYCKNPLTGQR